MDYIESKSSSNSFNSIVWSHLKFIWERLDSVYNSANKWTHKTLTKEEAERYVIFTFIILHDILSL